jgi:hypothetical protein
MVSISYSAKATAPIQQEEGRNFTARVGKVTYPLDGYGWEEAPKAENLLIKNATVWTNEKEGKLENTDVLVKGARSHGRQEPERCFCKSDRCNRQTCYRGYH